MNEEWRPVVGAPDYEVSNLGRVRSLKRRQAHILRPCVNPAGYHNHTLFVDGAPVFTYAHALVMAAFVGPRPDGMVIRHWDDNKDNNTVGNLLYGTPKDNVHDAIRNGRHPAARKSRAAA